ncbi:hypothetical protein D8S78_06625 [Natrialba swarupiae]|nr:hypothetical protein [Natrialba swarupiae]
MDRFQPALNAHHRSSQVRNRDDLTVDLQRLRGDLPVGNRRFGSVLVSDDVRVPACQVAVVGLVDDAMGREFAALDLLWFVDDDVTCFDGAATASGMTTNPSPRSIVGSILSDSA